MASEATSKTNHSRILSHTCHPWSAAWSTSFKLTTKIRRKFDPIDKISRAHCDLSDVLTWLEPECVASDIPSKMAADVMTHLMRLPILSLIGDFIPKHQPAIMIDIHLGHLRYFIQALQLGDV